MCIRDSDFEYDTVPCESVDLQQYYDKYCKEMTDAYYDEEKKELVPEVNGCLLYTSFPQLSE